VREAAGFAEAPPKRVEAEQVSVEEAVAPVQRGVDPAAAPPPLPQEAEPGVAPPPLLRETAEASSVAPERLRRERTQPDQGWFVRLRWVLVGLFGLMLVWGLVNVVVNWPSSRADTSEQQTQGAKPSETPPVPVSSQPVASQPDAGTTPKSGSGTEAQASSLNATEGTSKLVDAFTRQSSWQSDKVTGHYAEGTVSRRVSIRSVGSGRNITYKMYIDAQQAKFNCDLKFAENGDPETASNCVIDDGRGWWTKEVVHFTCGVSGKKEVCQGAYMLHFWPNDKTDEGYRVEPEKRVMRLERPVSG
jgi:hypothetical protein